MFLMGLYKLRNMKNYIGVLWYAFRACADFNGGIHEIGGKELGNTSRVYPIKRRNLM